mgnify:CR=1 FL=1
MRTEFCDKLGIEFPIFAFSHCRDVVAAVCKAGGMGVLGAAAHSPEQLEIDLKWIEDEIGDRPYGVDLIVPARYAGESGGGYTLEDIIQLIPAEPTLENYESLFDPGSATGGYFWSWFGNSLLIAVLTTLLSVFLASTAGYALSRYRFWGKRPMTSFFLTSQMFPAVILLVPLFVVAISLMALNILLQRRREARPA